MAKTYYKYAERDVNSQIDWSQVGKNLTDMLFDQAELRQNKRKELENASNDFGKVVSDMPTGISESWTNNTIDFANNVQEQRKLDDSLLAQGLMPLNMYLKKRELSKSSTEKFYGISKKMQAETAATVERIKSGTNMEREQRNLELIENLAVNGMPMLHDVTGELIVANMIDGPDGVKIIDPNKNNHMSVDQYDKLVTQKFDKYDFPSAANAWEDAVGDYLIANVDETDRARGLSFIIEKSGPAFRKDIETYIDDFVNTIKANPLHMESVLTDTMGKYKTTYDTDQAASDPNYILLVPDKNTGVAKADFTSPTGQAQEKAFEEFVKRQLYARLDEKLKITSAGYKPSDPTEAERLRIGRDEKKEQEAYKTIRLGLEGDPASLQIIANGLGAERIDLATDKKSATIVYTDGSTKTVNLADSESAGAAFAQLQGFSDQGFRDYAVKENFSGPIDVNKFETALGQIKGVTTAPKYTDEPQQQVFVRIQGEKIKGKIDPQSARNSRANIQATLGSIPGMEDVKVGSADSGKTIIISDSNDTELLRITPSEATPEQIANFENSLAQLSYNRTLGLKDGVKIIEQVTEGQRGKVKVTNPDGVGEKYNQY